MNMVGNKFFSKSLIAFISFFSFLILMADVNGSDSEMYIVTKGIHGQKAYTGGKLDFLDISLKDQIIHYKKEVTEIPLQLFIKYKVIEPAPLIISSRGAWEPGTAETWSLYSFPQKSSSELNVNEKIDLSKSGTFSVATDHATINRNFPLPHKGLCSLSDHAGYFAVDFIEGNRKGKYDMAFKPSLFECNPSLGRKLTFTLADLSQYSVNIAEILSGKDGEAEIIKVRLTVKDASGKEFPVINAKTNIRIGHWEGEFTAEYNSLNVPSGWLYVKLPENTVGGSALISAELNAMTPKGRRPSAIRKTVDLNRLRKFAQKESANKEFTPDEKYETRFVCSSVSNLQNRKSIEKAVQKISAANLNIIVPFIQREPMDGSGGLYAKSSFFPMDPKIEKGFDPLKHLIKVAHSKGIEVFIIVTIFRRDKKFCKAHPDMRLEDEKGKYNYKACLHKEAYRDFMADFIGELAKNYDIDGVCLDYIRIWGSGCFCEDCQKAFAKKFRKPLSKASREELDLWRYQGVSGTARKIRNKVKSIKPDVVLGAAVIDYEEGIKQGQNAVKMVKEGVLEVIFPMDYTMKLFSLHDNEEKFYKGLGDKYNDRLFPIVSSYVYKLNRKSRYPTSRNEEIFEKQIAILRDMGIKGYGIFRLNFINGKMMELLKNKINKTKTLPYYRKPGVIKQ